MTEAWSNICPEDWETWEACRTLRSSIAKPMHCTLETKLLNIHPLRRDLAGRVETSHWATGSGLLYIASCLGYLPIDDGLDCDLSTELSSNFCAA
jgi:hypothetical protein